MTPEEVIDGSKEREETRRQTGEIIKGGIIEVYRITKSIPGHRKPNKKQARAVSRVKEKYTHLSPGPHPKRPSNINFSRYS